MMSEALGKTVFCLMIFISGMAGTIVLEKLMILPATCQVDESIMGQLGYRQ